MSIKIIGTGAFVPERILTNDDLAQMVDTSDEWITQRVGVKTRHIATEQSAADMGILAAQTALRNAGITAEQLDLIICATISGDCVCPSAAAAIQAGIGAHCPAFDLNSACSGFLYALDTAAAFLARERVEYVLVLGCERISRLLDWTDRSTCVIFGDGAGAAVVTKGSSYLAGRLFTAGGDDVLHIPLGRGNSPFYQKEELPMHIMMMGQETFKFAVRRITEDLQTVCAQAGITVDDLAFIVPHQANSRIIDLAARRLKIPAERFVLNIEKYGNTSSASVPISLHELAESGRLHRGDLIALCAFGGGLSSAACVLRW